MKKNVASQIVGAQVTTAADGTDFTGTVTCFFTIDGGTQTIGSVGSGVCTHEGKGYHTYAPAQSETNGDLLSYNFSGSGAITSSVHVYTAFPQTVDNNVLAAGATGFTAIDTVADAIKVMTDKFVFTVANQVDANTLSVGGTTQTAGDIPASQTTAQNDLDIITGAAGALLDTTATSAQLVDDVWDEVLTGGTHNAASSSGRRLRAIQEFQGYEMGSIWVDTLNGTAGTTDFENGTVENPVLTWADALTLNTSLGLNSFHIANGSSITFTASVANFTIIGDNYTLALGGQVITSLFIQGANDLSGISSGTGYRIVDCLINGAISLNTGWIIRCRLNSTITLLGTGGYFFQNCFGTTGTVPVINFDAAIGAQTLCLTPYTGGVSIQNMKAGDLFHIEGGGEFTLESSCTAGTCEYAGDWRLTDSSATVTLAPADNTTNIAAILVDTADIQPNYATASALATVDTEVGLIQTDLDNATDGLGALKTLIDALNDLSAANINSEVSDVIKTDTITLPSQGAPPLTPTLEQAVAYLYKNFRNRKFQSATEWRLYADNETTIDHKATVSDDGTDAIKQEIVTGA